MAWNVEFFSFIIIACAALYYGYESRDEDRGTVSFTFSLLFWIATMYQWFVDQEGTQVIFIGWLYLFPIILCIYEVLMRAVAQLDVGTKVSGVE